MAGAIATHISHIVIANILCKYCIIVQSTLKTYTEELQVHLEEVMKNGMLQSRHLMQPNVRQK